MNNDLISTKGMVYGLGIGVMMWALILICYEMLK